MAASRFSEARQPIRTLVFAASYTAPGMASCYFSSSSGASMIWKSHSHFRAQEPEAQESWKLLSWTSNFGFPNPKALWLTLSLLSSLWET